MRSVNRHCHDCGGLTWYEAPRIVGGLDPRKPVVALDILMREVPIDTADDTRVHGSSRQQSRRLDKARRNGAAAVCHQCGLAMKRSAADHPDRREQLRTVQPLYTEAARCSRTPKRIAVRPGVSAARSTHSVIASLAIRARRFEGLSSRGGDFILHCGPDKGRDPLSPQVEAGPSEATHSGHGPQRRSARRRTLRQ